MNLLKLILGSLAAQGGGKPQVKRGQGLRLRGEIMGRITTAQRLYDWQRSCQQAEALAAKERVRHQEGPFRSRHCKRRMSVPALAAE
jgi:hypothetical protein